MDGLVKDRTQCAPNGYYFIPVYDKVNFFMDMCIYKHFLVNFGARAHTHTHTHIYILGVDMLFSFSQRIYFSLQGSFVIKVNGPDGWSWDPEKVCYFFVIGEILSWRFMFFLHLFCPPLSV